MRPGKGGVLLAVRVTPRAGRDELKLTEQAGLLARVTAPPADGQANKAVCQLVAKALGVPKSSVEIASGTSGRSKSLLVRDADQEDVERRLTSYFAGR